MKNKILIIEDDRDILTVLKANLELQGFEVFVAESWQAGEVILERQRPDLLILDLTLPDTDGLIICKGLREAGQQLPIIILTARDKLSDKIIGLESGADDYIVKPFETLELVARIKTCLRRLATKKEDEILSDGPLSIDVRRRIVKVAKKEVMLTPKEFNILHFIMTRKGEVVSREDIKSHLWKDAQLYAWSRVIDVHIQHIRHKLDSDDPERFIETVPGLGYRLKAKP
jgi:DNA-binding response OmpR family regulator